MVLLSHINAHQILVSSQEHLMSSYFSQALTFEGEGATHRSAIKQHRIHGPLTIENRSPRKFSTFECLDFRCQSLCPMVGTWVKGWWFAPSSGEPLELSTGSWKSSWHFCRAATKCSMWKHSFCVKWKKVSKTGTSRRKYESWGNKKSSTALSCQHSLILSEEGGEKVR